VQGRLTQLVERILWHEVPSGALRSDPKGYRSSRRGVGDQLVSAPPDFAFGPFLIGRWRSTWDGEIRQTTSSHRVLMYAYRKDPKLQLVLLQKIFTASDEQNKDVGDHDLLSTLTEEAGVMTKAEVRFICVVSEGIPAYRDCTPQALEFLASDKLLKEVHASIIEAQKRGITGVPCTIFNDKYAISGGQTADVYLEVRHQLRLSREL
jgi:hypothetical protein